MKEKKERGEDNHFTTMNDIIREKEKLKREKEAEKEKKRLEMIEYFEKKYNKLKEYEFKTMDEVNYQRHFYFPKSIMNTNRLSKTELSLYPVFCNFSDFRRRDWFPVSIATLAKFSGMSTKTVQTTLKYLTGNTLIHGTSRNVKYGGNADHDPLVVPILESKKIDVGSRHHNEYKVEFFRGDIINANKGRWFLFNTSIIETGSWAKLSVAAKALYIYMRVNGDVGACDYEEWQNIYEDGGFRYRKYDSLAVDISDISIKLKIRYDNVKKVIKELEDSGLCRRMDYYCLVGLTVMEQEDYDL